MKEQDFGYRKYVLGAIAMVIVLLYVARLAVLQLASDEYAGSAKSNALFNNVLYPSRGLIYDRNGQLLVYNQPTYDIMVVTNEIEDLDTLDFCHTINITKKELLPLHAAGVQHSDQWRGDGCVAGEVVPLPWFLHPQAFDAEV